MPARRDSWGAMVGGLLQHADGFAGTPGSPEGLSLPAGARRIGRHISTFAALRWLGVPEHDARELIAEARLRGELDHSVLAPERSGALPRRFLVRRMPGNHADVFALPNAPAQPSR